MTPAEALQLLELTEVPSPDKDVVRAAWQRRRDEVKGQHTAATAPQVRAAYAAMLDALEEAREVAEAAVPAPDPRRPRPAVPPPRPAKRVAWNRFEIGAAVPFGGPGGLYPAIDLKHPNHRHCALFVGDYRLNADPKTWARAVSHVRTAATNVSHPNLIRALDAAPTKRAMWVAAEPVAAWLSPPHEPLSSVMAAVGNDGQWSQAAALAVVLNVAAGLAALHAHDDDENRPLVHAGLGPGHIFVDVGALRRLEKQVEQADGDGAPAIFQAQGVARVLYLGMGQMLADAQRQNGGTLTADKTYLGPPLLRPAEQTGDASVPLTPAADVYALAALLYLLLVGTPPARRYRRPLRKGRPDVPEALAKVVDEVLAAPAADRLADAGAFIAAIETALSHRPAERAPEVAVEVEEDHPPAQPKPAPAAAAPVRRPARPEERRAKKLVTAETPRVRPDAPPLRPVRKVPKRGRKAAVALAVAAVAVAGLGGVGVAMWQGYVPVPDEMVALLARTETSESNEPERPEPRADEARLQAEAAQTAARATATASGFEYVADAEATDQFEAGRYEEAAARWAAQEAAIRRASESQQRWEAASAQTAATAGGLGNAAKVARMLQEAGNVKAGEAETLLTSGKYDEAAAAFEIAADLRDPRNDGLVLLTRARARATDSDTAVREAVARLDGGPALAEALNAEGGVTLADVDAEVATLLLENGEVSDATGPYDTYAQERRGLVGELAPLATARAAAVAAADALDGDAADAADQRIAAADEALRAGRRDEALTGWNAVAQQASLAQAKPQQPPTPTSDPAAEMARRQAEQEAQRQAEQEQVEREAQEQAQREAEQMAQRQAEEKARQEAAEQARREAEAKQQAVVEAAWQRVNEALQAASAPVARNRETIAREADYLPQSDPQAGRLVRLGSGMDAGLQRLTDLVAAAKPGEDAAVVDVEALDALATDVAAAGEALVQWSEARRRLLRVQEAIAESGETIAVDEDAGDWLAAPSSVAEFARLASQAAKATHLQADAAGAKLLRDAADQLVAAAAAYEEAGGEITENLVTPPTDAVLDAAVETNAYDLASDWRRAAAVYQAETQRLTELLAGATVADEQGRTPLHHAALAGDVATLRDLLRLDIDPRPLDNRSRTPFGLALEAGNAEAAKLLAEQGGVPAGWIEAGQPVIFLAASSADAVRVAREIGAPTQVLSRGETALHALAWQANAERLSTREQLAAAEELLKSGIDPRHRNPSRRTAADVADSLGLGELARRLRQAESAAAGG